MATLYTPPKSPAGEQPGSSSATPSSESASAAVPARRRGADAGRVDPFLDTDTNAASPAAAPGPFAAVRGVSANIASGQPTAAPEAAATGWGDVDSGTGKISRYELASLTTQLCIMTRAGVDLVSALTSLQRQARSRVARQVLADVRDDVLSGKSFSSALGRRQQSFGATYVATVAAGEVAGELAEVLQQLSQTIRAEMRLRRSLQAMLIYPITLAVTAVLVLGCLVLFILPRFAEIFSQFGTQLPQLTSVVLAIGGEISQRWWVWGPAAVGLLAASSYYLRSPQGRVFMDRWLLGGSILRRVGRPLLAGRACRLLGLMLSSGVPLLEAIRLTRAGMNSVSYHDLFIRLEDDVLNGRGFAMALAEYEFVPAMAAEMLSTAEQTGTLGEVACLLAEHFDAQGESRLRELIAMLEPVVTIVMGLIVAAIVLSVMLPMFDLSVLADQGAGP